MRPGAATAVLRRTPVHLHTSSSGCQWPTESNLACTGSASARLPDSAARRASLYYIALLMQMHGIRVRVEPRNLINRFIPRTFRPDVADDETKRAIQGAIPDI